MSPILLLPSLSFLSYSPPLIVYAPLEGYFASVVAPSTFSSYYERGDDTANNLLQISPCTTRRRVGNENRAILTLVDREIGDVASLKFPDEIIEILGKREIAGGPRDLKLSNSRGPRPVAASIVCRVITVLFRQRL